MTTLTGTYFKGRLVLDKPIITEKPIKVTILFIEEDEKKIGLKLSDFSFLETQELLKDCKTSFSDEVIEDRRMSV